MPAFTYAYDVGFADVDAAGIVYYPRFFHCCHLALEALFRQTGPTSYFDLIYKRKLGLPIVHIEADYKRPLLYGDKVIIQVSTRSMGTVHDYPVLIFFRKVVVMDIFWHILLRFVLHLKRVNPRGYRTICGFFFDSLKPTG